MSDIGFNFKTLLLSLGGITTYYAVSRNTVVNKLMRDKRVTNVKTKAVHLTRKIRLLREKRKSILDRLNEARRNLIISIRKRTIDKFKGKSKSEITSQTILKFLKISSLIGGFYLISKALGKVLSALNIDFNLDFNFNLDLSGILRSVGLSKLLEIKDWFSKKISSVLENIEGFFSKIKDLWIEFKTDPVSFLKRVIKAAGRKIKEFTLGAFETGKKVIVKSGQLIKKGLQKTGQFIKGGWNWFKEKLGIDKKKIQQEPLIKLEKIGLRVPDYIREQAIQNEGRVKSSKHVRIIKQVLTKILSTITFEEIAGLSCAARQKLGEKCGLFSDKLKKVREYLRKNFRPMFLSIIQHETGFKYIIGQADKHDTCWVQVYVKEGTPVTRLLKAAGFGKTAAEIRRRLLYDDRACLSAGLLVWFTNIDYALSGKSQEYINKVLKDPGKLMAFYHRLRQDKHFIKYYKSVSSIYEKNKQYFEQITQVAKNVRHSDTRKKLVEKVRKDKQVVVAEQKPLYSSTKTLGSPVAKHETGVTSQPTSIVGVRDLTFKQHT